MSELVGLPVADVWWVGERVDDGITRVTEPHVHPFLRCNVWHVEGRDADLAARLVREHSLDLAKHVKKHVNYLQ